MVEWVYYELLLPLPEHKQLWPLFDFFQTSHVRGQILTFFDQLMLLSFFHLLHSQQLYTLHLYWLCSALEEENNTVLYSCQGRQLANTGMSAHNSLLLLMLLLLLRLVPQGECISLPGLSLDCFDTSSWSPRSSNMAHCIATSAPDIFSYRAAIGHMFAAAPSVAFTLHYGQSFLLSLADDWTGLTLTLTAFLGFVLIPVIWRKHLID